jgi:peptidoglycan/LPS O-acetylase OafA/YrhL
MPAFYGYLLFCVAWKLARGNPVNWRHLASAATYTVNYFNAFWGDPSSGFSHAWSLAVEEQFYLVWPFAFLALKSRSILGRSIVAAIASVVVVRIALKLFTPLPQSYFYSALEMRADSLLLGAGLAVLWIRSEVPVSQRVRGIGAKRIILAAFLGVATLAVLELHFGHPFRDTITASLLPTLLSLIVISSIVRGENGEATWLASPMMVWLGRLSYSTYLYQQMVPGWGAKLLPTSARIWQWAIECCCVLILASGSFYLVERPALRLKERLAPR